MQVLVSLIQLSKFIRKFQSFMNLTSDAPDIANLTRNVSDSTLIAALNITLPALTKVPGIGRSTKSFIDFGSTIVLVVFIISLIGNGFSIILSVAAFVAPSNGKIHAAGAGISMLSTQMLQVRISLEQKFFFLTVSLGLRELFAYSDPHNTLR